MVDSRTLAYTFLERSTRRYYCVSSFRSDICGSMLFVSSKMTPGTNYFRSKGWTAYMVMRCLRLLLQPGVMRTQASFQIRRHLLKLETPPINWKTTFKSASHNPCKAPDGPQEVGPFRRWSCHYVP